MHLGAACVKDAYDIVWYSTLKRCKAEMSITEKLLFSPLYGFGEYAENEIVAFTEAYDRCCTARLECVPSRRLLRAVELYSDQVRRLGAVMLGHLIAHTVLLNDLRVLATALAVEGGSGATTLMRDHVTNARRVLCEVNVPGMGTSGRGL